MEEEDNFPPNGSKLKIKQTTQYTPIISNNQRHCLISPKEQTYKEMQNNSPTNNYKGKIPTHLFQ